MKLQQYQDPDVIRSVLARPNVAIVGLSGNPLRASNFVGRYLQIRGYNVIPVNPRESEILGNKSWPSLSEIPEKVDTVDVFRQPEVVPAIAEEAIAIGASCLWMQFGVISEKAAEMAAAAGLDVVMDKCIKVEHARYLGRMHWLGFNTGRITALRGLPT
ncbi:MAG: CoA-binding protein [Woeseiaceae bacterium]|nr:CoA-binding protein [Woeseiaceae bacterium]